MYSCTYSRTYTEEKDRAKALVIPHVLEIQTNRHKEKINDRCVNKMFSAYHFCLSNAVSLFFFFFLFIFLCSDAFFRLRLSDRGLISATHYKQMSKNNNSLYIIIKKISGFGERNKHFFIKVLSSVGKVGLTHGGYPFKTFSLLRNLIKDTCVSALKSLDACQQDDWCITLVICKVGKKWQHVTAWEDAGVKGSAVQVSP